MGKQGRRKQRQKRKQQQDQQPRKEEGGNVVNPASAVHQLRHPEPKTRHAALIAMQTTILHPDQTKKISLDVLQAIREQVMDTHLDCASSAAECLSQYLYLISSRDDGNDPYKEATAGWAFVFISRLDQCLTAILQEQQQKKDGGGKSQKPWYALTAPCLRALCKLVEGNELALEQVHTQIQTFLTTIFGLLQTSLTALEMATSTAPVDERFVDWINETTIFAARTLHSSLDENEQLASAIHIEAIQYWTNDNNASLSKLPDLTQLHIMGSIVTLYQLEPSKWESILVSNIVVHGCGIPKFLMVDTNQMIRLQNGYEQAKKLWLTQKHDSEMEQDIIRKVEERREPARMIARRQKANPRNKTTGESGDGEKDEGMKEDATMGGGDDGEEEQPDGQQAMEDALVAWNSGVVLPMQVALEVTANLLSSLIEDQDAMAMDDDGGRDTSVQDQTLRDGIVAAKVTERCLQMLQVSCDYQQQQEQQKQGAAEDGGQSPIAVLLQDLDECISKISACLVNCVLGQVMTPAETQRSWQLLRRYANKKGVCSVLVVLTQHTPKLREQLSQDVELFASLLQINDGDVQRDTVCLLTATISPGADGMLPPSDVVSKVTTELLRLLKDGLTIGVKCEVLHGFMDLYGEDDYHPHVFDDLKVCAAIQQSLSSSSSRGNLEPEDEEILFNAGRFVDYKLGR